VETYLVNLGFTANRNLINKHNTKIERWGILGLIRRGQGKVARGTGEFRRMMGFVA
jgi:hypothetical protein